MRCESGRNVGLAMIVSLAITGSACGVERREAASLIEAVDRYRRADIAAKAPLADALARVPCTAVDVCHARDACLAAARPTVQGAVLKREVEASLAELRAGKITREEAGGRALPQKLDDAARLLEDGRAKIGACEAETTALRLKYGL